MSGQSWFLTRVITDIGVTRLLRLRGQNLPSSKFNLPFKFTLKMLTKFPRNLQNFTKCREICTISRNLHNFPKFTKFPQIYIIARNLHKTSRNLADRWVQIPWPSLCVCVRVRVRVRVRAGVRVRVRACVDWWGGGRGETYTCNSNIYKLFK